MIWRRKFASNTHSRSNPNCNAISNNIKCNPAIHFLTIASNWIGSKKRIWLTHDLTERNTERRKFMCKMLLYRHKRKTFLHHIVTGDNITTTILAHRKYGYIPVKLAHQRKSRVIIWAKWCSVLVRPEGCDKLWDPETFRYYY